MKTLFINAESNLDITQVLKKVKIKGKIGLITNIQHLYKLKQVQKILKNSIIGGQILGCNIKNALKIKNKVNAFLYIGTGIFHPIQVQIKTKKPVYIANPLTNEFSKLQEKNIQEYEKKLKTKIIKFYSADTLGIIVSTKTGQYKLKQAIDLKNKLKKKTYLFITDNIDYQELENFPDIDLWINTACPRIEYKNIINLDELPKT